MLRRIQQGFTLFETLLVLGILSGFLVMSLRYVSQKATEARIDKTSIQYQQILNASLTFYLNTSSWPTNISTLITNGYLVPGFSGSWSFYSDNKLFYVYSQPFGTAVSNIAEANRVAGKLPQGFASLNYPPAGSYPACSAGSGCYVSAAVPVPGQSLNNARSVNFANLYHPGACVPAPTCPANMTAKIMVIPVSVSGLNDKGSSTVYPISSFTAYAVPSSPQAYNSMPSCGSSPPKDCEFGDAPITTGLLWRVCLEIVSEVGELSTVGTPPNDEYGQDVSVLAITRCSPNTEPQGSDFTVYEKP